MSLKDWLPTKEETEEFWKCKCGKQKVCYWPGHGTNPAPQVPIASGGYISVDRTEALKRCWGLIQKLIKSGGK